MTKQSDDIEQAELKTFVPGAYDPCYYMIVRVSLYKSEAIKVDLEDL